MPNFDYIAKHDDGRTIRGTAAGDTIQEVITTLALNGMLVIKINPTANPSDPIPTSFTQVPKLRPTETRAPKQPSGMPSAAPSVPQGNPYDQPIPAVTPPAPSETPKAPSDQRSYIATSVVGPLVGTVPLADLQIFFRQYAAMQNAGVPMSKSLGTLAKQSRIPKLQRIIQEMEVGAEAGRPISSVLQRYPEVFSGLMVSLVRAGEEGGFLVNALTLTAEYIQTEIEIRNQWKKATLYPKMIIGSSILIVLATNAIIANCWMVRPR